MNKNGFKILKDNFGYSTLRPAQEPVIESILNSQDTLAIMPTGGGKSLCFQLPALLNDGLTVVISPLIALMHDQVESLKENGIWAEYINSSIDDDFKNIVMEGVATHKKDSDATDKLKLLYISPEKLFANESYLLHYFKTINVSMFAIDEAHCISSWGHDFRPEYSNLGVLKDHFPKIPIIALTATADNLTRNDIVNKLNLVSPNIFISSFDRPNINYTVVDRSDGFGQLYNFIVAHKDVAGIIYCLSRKSTEELVERLKKNNIKAAAYHAKIPKEQKDKVYSDFMKDDIQVVVATIAFGMGIDKPNVRYVIHWNLPKSIENYYQETGRAGRDGLPAEALLLYNVGDLFTLKKFIDSGNEDNPYIGSQDIETFRKIQHDKLGRLVEFCKTGHCRRRVLLQYFQEKLPHDCGNCDCCTHPRKKLDGTVFAQKIISAIVRTNQQYGLTYIINILLGITDDRMLKNGHDKIPTFGIGKDLSKDQWIYYVNQLIDLGLVKIKYDGYIKTLILDQMAIDFIQSGIALELVEYVDSKPIKPVKTKANKDQNLNPLQTKLFEVLRTLRKQLADDESIPPYMIFGDATLVELVTSLPFTVEDFGNISGVGKIKKEKFGTLFVRTIEDFCDINTELVPTQDIVARPVKLAPVSTTGTMDETLKLFNLNKNIDAIASQRKLSKNTIIQHIIQLRQNNKIEDIDYMEILNPELLDIINAEKKAGVNYSMLTQWKNHLKEKYDTNYEYDDIKLCLE